jgi:diaminopimelate decarboxylase
MTLIPGTPFSYRNGELHIEGCPLARIAEAVGTPAYVYSRRAIEDQYRAYEKALESIPHLICYGMKACSNLAILHLLGSLGAGVDLVSGGELFRARRAGIPPERMIFSGVAKTREEIRQAVQAGILMLNVESRMELEAISRVAVEEGRTAGISIRINPDIDPHTHPYISTGLEENKFGLSLDAAMEAYQAAAKLPGIEVRGIQSHIGSQITDISVFGEALDKLMKIDRDLEALGIRVQYIDIGGGLGIAYTAKDVPGPDRMIATLRERLGRLGKTLLLEPGRSMVGNSGVLLTRVVYYKENRRKRFALVDAGMTDLMRPALYGAHHEVVPVIETNRESVEVDVAGPVCESTDVLARGRSLPRPETGDLYGILSAGAYSFSMASRYNSRPLPPEVLVEGDRYRVIRSRETYEDLIAHETL